MKQQHRRRNGGKAKRVLSIGWTAPEPEEEVLNSSNQCDDSEYPWMEVGLRPRRTRRARRRSKREKKGKKGTSLRNSNLRSYILINDTPEVAAEQPGQKTQRNIMHSVSVGMRDRSKIK